MAVGGQAGIPESLRDGGRLHGLAGVTGETGGGLRERRAGAGGQRLADADLDWGGAGGQAWPGVREAEPGLGLPVTVPVAVDDDAAAGQASQRAIPAGPGQRGGQACGGRAGAGGGDDGAAGGGEGDLPGTDGLAGPAALARGDRVRGGGPRGGAGQFH